MFNDVARIFYNNVFEDFKRYQRQRDSLEVGFNKHLISVTNFASSLYHFREHLLDYKNKIKNLHRENGDYNLIRSICNVSKHGNLDDKSHIIESASKIEEIFITVYYKDDLGVFPLHFTRVVAYCTDKISRDVDKPLVNILNFWGNFLEENKLIGSWVNQNYGVDFLNEPLNRNDTLGTVKMEILKGAPNGVFMQFWEFDYSLGYAVNISRPDHAPELHIRPVDRHALCLSFNKKDGSTRDIEIELTEEENIEFIKAINEEARQKFMEKIYQKRFFEITRKLK